MKEPKRYYCGNGEGMFEDDKNGHWVEYSEHKAIVETLTEQLRKHDVGNRRELLCAFFKYFRDNGEANIGMTIEEFVDRFLSTQRFGYEK